MNRTKDDPQLVRNQSALWTAPARRWLVPAAVLALVATAMLAATMSLDFLASILGIATVAELYVLMGLCAILIRSAHRRNLVLAWLMVAIAAV